MPKATKKKKEKAADFKKAKLKLGKGKKAATNATDTSFKARSIALPSQKPLARALAGPSTEQNDAPISSTPQTAAGLNIDDVLVQLRHVNAGVRREAVNHLREVLAAGIALGVSLGERHGEVAKVLRAIGGLISDEDGPVRKSLHDFVAWYLARLPRVALSPYLPLLTLQIASGLSHIFPAIRLDTCRLVLLLLDADAPGVVGTWPSRAPSTNTLVGTSTIFDGLRLAAGLGEEKANAGFRLTGQSKLVILKTLRTFVERALDPSSSSPTKEGVKDGGELGRWSLTDLANDDWSLGTYAWALEWQTPATNDGSGEGAASELQNTYTALHTLLLNTFMEAAPAAFAPSGSSDETALALCAEAVDLVRLFASSLLEGEYASPDPAVRALFGEFVKRMTAWFPFDRRASSASSSSEALFALSLNYARLATLLAPPAPPLTSRKGGWRARVRAIEAAWAGMKGGSKANDAALSAAAEWVADSLSPSSSDALAPQLSAQAYADLLPIVWSFLLRPPQEESMLEALASAALKQAGGSAKRRASDALLMRVVRAHEDRFATETLFVPLASAARGLVRQWIGAAPRTLWEMGARDAAASGRLLSFLLSLSPSRRAFEAPYSLVDDATVSALAGKLGPFFHLQHPSRGAVEGPWAQLPAHEQRLALDVARVWSLVDSTGRLAGAVTRAVGTQSAPAWAKLYWERE